MPPLIALSLWLVLLLGLLRYDPARVPGTSPALWVPVIHLVIMGSRLPSMWLAPRYQIAAQAFEEGNALDRVVYIILMLLAFGILTSRAFRWSDFVERNIPLTGVLFFCLLSVVWSDYPFVAFKRWFRDIGSYLSILVVLTDPRPLDAVRSVFRRVCFLLIPLSIVLYKYFPEVGRQYDTWTGQIMYVGATTSKNMLGVLCLLSGLFFVWDTFTRWPDRRERRTRHSLVVNVAFIAITLWVLYLSDSATSRLCLGLGCVVLAATHSDLVKRNPRVLTVPISIALCLYFVVAFGFGIDINAVVAAAVGRDPTLTGRTEIWDTLLSTGTNPLVGTGYESFWLGPRLPWIWERVGTINEAHNGYLQVYLNLGLIGLSLVVVLLVAAYLAICKRLAPPSPLGSLGLALWTVLMVYNVSESAFLIGLLWMAILPLGLSWNDRVEKSAKSAPGTTATRPRRRSFVPRMNRQGGGTTRVVGRA